MIHLTILIIVLLFLLRRAGRVRHRRHSALYRSYIPSAAWRAMKAKVYAHYGRACQKCGSQRNLQIHHKHYRTLGRERLSDVQVLCVDCHRIADAKRRKNAKRWRWLWT